MVGASFSGTSIHCYDKHQQKKKYYDAIDDNNTMTSSTSTITTTATSLHSSIRDHDDDTELLSSSSSSSSSSPLMSFDFHELQHNNSDKPDDKSTHNDDNNNNNNNNNNSSSSSTSSASASSSSSSYWSLYQYVDLRYTMLSNLIFLLGSSCQTFLAIIDLRASIRRKAEMENDDYDYDYDYYYAGDDTYVYTVQDDVYYILYGLGPFLCIINACIDLRWQLEYSKISPLSSLSSCCRRCWCFFRGSERKQQESVTSSSSSITSSSTLSDDYDVSSPLHYEDSIDDSSLSTFHSTESSSSSSLSGEYWGYVVVSLFGLGSVLSFYSTFLDDYFEDQDKWDDDSYLIKMEKKRPWYACNYKINFIAIHLYLLSGVVDLLVQRNSMSAGGSRNKLSCDIRKLFSVCFNRSNTNNNNNTSDDAKQLLSKNNSFSSSEEVEEGVEETTTRIAKLCMFIGTFLFVSGTLLDCTIAILYDPQQRHELNPDHIVNIDKVLLGTAGLTSCLLWTIDAILYIIADFFLYSLHIEDSKARRFLSNGFKIPSSITDHTNDSDSNHHSDTATTVSTIPMQFIEEKQQHKLVDVLLSSSTTNETVPLLLSSDDEPHKYYNRV